MEGLVQFGQAILPGTTEVDSAVGDDTRALLLVTSRVKFGADACSLFLVAAAAIALRTVSTRGGQQAASPEPVAVHEAA